MKQEHKNNTIIYKMSKVRTNTQILSTPQKQQTTITQKHNTATLSLICIPHFSCNIVP